MGIELLPEVTQCPECGLRTMVTALRGRARFRLCWLCGHFRGALLW